jgi:hypothetical protein
MREDESPQAHTFTHLRIHTSYQIQVST